MESIIAKLRKTMENRLKWRNSVYIPSGNYLTLPEYMRRVGVRTRGTIFRAIESGRLGGAIQISYGVWIIPEDAVIKTKILKHGHEIGVRAWMRGEIEHQEELQNWELRKRQLLQVWKEQNGIVDDTRGESPHDDLD
jgi:hypothetical protein